MFSISDSRVCCHNMAFFFLDSKLSPTEVGMKRLYEFKYCLEFIFAVCLKLDLYLSSSHCWVRVCIPIFRILRVLSMNQSKNNMAWIKEEHYFVALSKVKRLKLKLPFAHHWMSGKVGLSWTACFFSCCVSLPSTFPFWNPVTSG